MDCLAKDARPYGVFGGGCEQKKPRVHMAFLFDNFEVVKATSISHYYLFTTLLYETKKYFSFSPGLSDWR